MKILKVLLTICLLVNSLNAQTTAAQVVGNWIDDGSNTALDTTKCCAPIATSAAPLVFSAGTGTTLTVKGTFSNTGVGCTSTGLGSQSINAQNQALSTATPPLVSVPITFNSPATLTANTPLTGKIITLSYPLSSTVTCSIPITLTNAVTTGDFSTWYSATNAPATYGTTSGGTSCCFPTAIALAATNKITLTWDGTSTGCTALGLTGSKDYTGTFDTTNNRQSFALSIPSTASSLTLTSATAATYNYYSGLSSCSYTLKKNTSSGANNLHIPVITFLFGLICMTF